MLRVRTSPTTGGEVPSTCFRPFVASLLRRALSIPHPSHRPGFPPLPLVSMVHLIRFGAGRKRHPRQVLPQTQHFPSMAQPVIPAHHLPQVNNPPDPHYSPFSSPFTSSEGKERERARKSRRRNEGRHRTGWTGGRSPFWSVKETSPGCSERRKNWRKPGRRKARRNAEHKQYLVAVSCRRLSAGLT